MSEPAKSSKGMVVGLVLNTLVSAAVLGVVLLRPGASPPPPPDAAVSAPPPANTGPNDAATPAPAAAGPIAPLGEYVVHLRNPEVDRYLRIALEVELSAETEKQALAARMPVIRDLLIGYLSDRTLEELRGSEALARTKADLLVALGGVVPDARLRSLYVTEFVVQ